MQQSQCRYANDNYAKNRLCLSWIYLGIFMRFAKSLPQKSFPLLKNYGWSRCLLEDQTTFCLRRSNNIYPRWSLTKRHFVRITKANEVTAWSTCRSRAGPQVGHHMRSSGSSWDANTWQDDIYIFIFLHVGRLTPWEITIYFFWLFFCVGILQKILKWQSQWGFGL